MLHSPALPSSIVLPDSFYFPLAHHDRHSLSARSTFQSTRARSATRARVRWSTRRHMEERSRTASLEGSLRTNFDSLRASLDLARSRDHMFKAIFTFVNSLPPFYAVAARHYVISQRKVGRDVNLDDLAVFFSTLEQVAAPATATRTHASRRIPHHSPPLPRAMPHLHLQHMDSLRPILDPTYIDFAPSRPLVSNLVLADEDVRRQAHTTNDPRDTSTTALGVRKN